MNRPLPGVSEAIAQMTAAIRQSLAELEEGALIDFSGLQSELEQLCGRATSLPKPEQFAILPAMIALRELFDQLTEQLTRLTSAEPDIEVSARQAAAAYGKIAGQF